MVTLKARLHGARLLGLENRDSQGIVEVSDKLSYVQRQLTAIEVI
jgi:hypothetical protein